MKAAAIAGLLGTASLAVGACASTPEVALCVRTAPDDHPFEADSTELVLRATPLEGQAIQGFFDPDDKTLRLPALDYGTWSFTLESRLGTDVVRARGRTPFVAIDSEDARVPCLYFATVGTFGDLVEAPDVGAVRLAFSSLLSSSALLASDDGLLAYDHETGTFAATLLDPPVPSAAGALWTSLGGGKALVITLDGRGAVVGADGARVSEVMTLQDVGPLHGAAAVAVGERSVLLVGGAGDPSAAPDPDVTALRVVDLADGSVRPLGVDLGPGVRDTRVASLGNNKFVIAGGNEGSVLDAPEASAIIAVIDPAVGVIGEGTLDVARRDAAIAVLGGNVLVFGGRDSVGGRLDAIERFQIAEGQPPIHLARPIHPLTTARFGALAFAVQGAVLVVGGDTGAAETDVTADRYTFESDGAVPANAPGVALPSPAAVELHDGTFLVVSPNAAVVYRP